MRRTMFIWPIVLFVVLMGIPAFAFAQEPTAEDAQALFQAQKWSEAAQAYEAMVKKEAQNPLFWNRLGYSRHNLQDYAGAAQAYEKAVALSKVKNPTVLYNLACAYARLTMKEKALASLLEAAGAGFNQPASLENDSDLESIRPEPQFKTILAQVQNNATPYANDPLHRQFDFWVNK